MSTNPFMVGFDEDTVPLDVLQAMGRMQASRFDEFVIAMRVACASVADGVKSSVASEHAPSQPHSHSGTPSGKPLAASHNIVQALQLDITTFSGRSDIISPEVFLERLVKYARAAHRDYNWLLLEVIPVVLVDDAGRWWTSRGGYTMWDAFVRDFLRAFSQPDRTRRLRRELEFRTQHLEEDFGSFVRVINAYYERIGCATSEEEKVERVLAQATPATRYMLMGGSFATMRDLEDVGPEIQEHVWRNATYRPPPSLADSMEKDLSFQPSECHVAASPAPSAYVRGNLQREECHRCHGIGHRASQCPSPRTDSPRSVAAVAQPRLSSAPRKERR